MELRIEHRVHRATEFWVGLSLGGDLVWRNGGLKFRYGDPDADEPVRYVPIDWGELVQAQQTLMDAVDKATSNPTP